jgi:murein DD-endopeptidase MepM/ murein hydrolase activator NlpD
MFKEFYTNKILKGILILLLFAMIILFISISFFLLFTASIAASDTKKTNNTNTQFFELPEYSFSTEMIKEKDGEKYLDWFFPLAENYKYNYVDTFGADRTYGGNRKHLGIDIMADEGVPITSIESGIVEQIGWNYLGGWRIGIRSDDSTRYWYYAHLRKLHPYVKTIDIGSKIESGQVIGYVGSTGYDTSILRNSMPENENAVDGKFDTHLHIGFNINGEGYINPYPILQYLEENKMEVKKTDDEYEETGKSIGERLISD